MRKAPDVSPLGANYTEIDYRKGNRSDFKLLDFNCPGLEDNFRSFACKAVSAFAANLDGRMNGRNLLDRANKSLRCASNRLFGNT